MGDGGAPAEVDRSLRLRDSNLGFPPIILQPGVRVCQRIFELTLGVPVRVINPNYG
jgi:hypothetical protein